MQTLAERTLSSDERAQQELGIRFEEGIGVTQNLGLARWPYRYAATPSGRLHWVYVPAKTTGGKGYSMPIHTRIGVVAVTEARKRLAEHVMKQESLLVKQRLEQIFLCLREFQRCATKEDAGSFREAGNSDGDGEIQREMIEFLSGTGNRINIVDVVQQDSHVFDVHVEFVFRRVPTCLPRVDDDVGEAECFQYESLGKSYTVWRVLAPTAAGLEIIVGPFPRIAVAQPGFRITGITVMLWTALCRV